MPKPRARCATPLRPVSSLGLRPSLDRPFVPGARSECPVQRQVGEALADVGTGPRHRWSVLVRQCLEPVAAFAIASEPSKPTHGSSPAGAPQFPAHRELPRPGGRGDTDS
jgi:hypothetical protein